MDVPDFYTVIQAFLSILGTGIGVFIAFPAIKDAIGAANSDFIRIAAGAFTGSSTAGIIFMYFKERFYYLPLWFARNHVIICGLNDRSMLIIDGLMKQKKKPVVIEPDGKNPWADACKGMGIIVLAGDCSDPALLKRARIQRAAHLLSLSDSDERNAGVAISALQLSAQGRKKVIRCVVRIVNPVLFGIIRKQELAFSTSGFFRIEFFNQYALGAKVLLDMYSPGDPGGERDGQMPVVVIGAGRLGGSLIARMARLRYTVQKQPDSRLKIYLIDQNAEKICENLQLQYPLMTRACELLPVPLDIQSLAFKRGEPFGDPALAQGFTAYICLDDDSLGLYAALTIHHHMRGKKIRIVVRMDHNASVGRLIAEENCGIEGIREIFPVNILEITSKSDLILAGEQETLARAIHENYCRKELEKGETRATNRLLVPWEELSSLTGRQDGINGEIYRESNRRQAEFIGTKLKTVRCDIGPVSDWDAPAQFRFTEKEIEILARIEHDRWMSERQEAGWTYGQVRNDRKKTHPSLVPYEKLTEVEKEKDRNTIRQIPEILALIDFQIYRMPAQNSS